MNQMHPALVPANDVPKPICTLSDDCINTLNQSIQGWRMAKVLAIGLGLDVTPLRYTPRQFVEATITDGSPDNPTPCTEAVKEEIKQKFEEAVQFAAGLMGSV